jgi:hypothetical protein
MLSKIKVQKPEPNNLLFLTAQLRRRARNLFFNEAWRKMWQSTVQAIWLDLEVDYETTNYPFD